MSPDVTADDHDRFADWDAAYVLGALAAADRREFEAHLAACARCRAAVAELAPVAALLSRLSAEDVDRIDDGPDAAARVGLVSLAHERARRRRLTIWITSVAAAIVLIAAIAVPVAIGTSVRPTESFALQETAGVPLVASVQLTDVRWGTRIHLSCAYPDEDDVSDVPEGGWTYVLAVVGRDGTDSTVSSWLAAPGTSARLDAGVALSTSAISAIEIRSAKGKVLMRYELAPVAG